MSLIHMTLDGPVDLVKFTIERIKQHEPANGGYRQWISQDTYDSFIALLGCASFEPEENPTPEKHQPDLCPYCKKSMQWDQFKEIWICPAHGKFSSGVKIHDN